jgi:glucosyl-3-phosphoglycerate synthase
MNVTVVFPARNEIQTIAKCIEVVKQSKYKPEVLVVDGNSADTTRNESLRAGATVIRQSKGIYPAKGIAMKDGIKKAIKQGADIIVFLDADITNLTPEWVDLLVDPVVEKECDMSRGFYRRAAYDGAVTKLIARPLSWILFPEIAHFNQPLSGEICATAGLFETLIKNRNCPAGWGIDIWFLIEAAMKDYHIAEVYLGSKVHTSRHDYLTDVIKLAKMAEQVNLAIFNQAIIYKRIDNVKRARV